MGLTITKEEIAKLPIETFSGKIEVIDDIKKYPMPLIISSQNKYLVLIPKPNRHLNGDRYIKLLLCNFQAKIHVFVSVEPYWVSRFVG